MPVLPFNVMNQKQPPVPRGVADPTTDTTTRTLIVVGITCGTLAAVVLIGIVVYLVLQYRRRNDKFVRGQHRHSVPATSRIRNGYTRTRAESNSTMGSRKTTRSQGYFKSWSSRTKTAYLTLPVAVPGVLATPEPSAPQRIQLGGYQYDPALPRREQPQKKKSMRERLRLDTNIIAPSPKLEPHRQSLLMQSATSPPPFVQYFPPPNLGSPRLGRPIRARAELQVGDSSPVPKARGGGATGLAGLASFIPPRPPSWASFWPTESGWTGPGGDPSIRDEDFGSDSDESWGSHKKPHLDSDEDEPSGRLDPALGSRKRKLDDDDQGGQYALDRREVVVEPFRLTPRDLRGPGPTGLDRASSRGTVSPELAPLTIPEPEPAMTMLASPQVDLLEDSTMSTDSGDKLERKTTGNLTLAFGRGKIGRSNTKSSAKSRQTAHSRNVSSLSGSSYIPPSPIPGIPSPVSVPPVPHLERSATQSTRRTKGSKPSRSNTTRTGLTRSNTTRTDRTDATEMSTVSGQILAAFSGHVATPLLRSVDSLRRGLAGGNEDEDEDDGASEAPEPPVNRDVGPVSMPTVRRLPVPPVPVPPVPAIPQRLQTEPVPRPLPAPIPGTTPRSVSLTSELGQSRPTSIRPLPVPPISSQ